MTRTKPVRGLDNVQVRLIESTDDAFDFMRWLSEASSWTDRIAGDTETTGLNTRKDRVRLAQVGAGDMGWAIPFERWGGVFEEAIRKWEGTYLFHNAPYDWRMLRRENVHVDRSRISDTRPSVHIVNPAGSTALKPVCGKFVDARADYAQQDLDEAIKTLGWDGVPVTLPAYWQYGALDTVLTWKLDEYVMPRIWNEGAQVAYELENEVLWPVTDMEDYGVHVDTVFAQLHYDKFMAYCEQVEDWCWTNYRVKPGSNASIVKILQEAGYEFGKATKGGAVALDAEVLSRIDHPLAQAVLKRRQLQKLASTYLSYYIEHADGDGLIYPSINTLGARTSRMSMSGPNLQNLPRKSERNPAATIIRNCVTTRYEDGLLIFCDFDQIEARGLAHLSEDEAMIAAFMTGEDFFVNMARTMYNDPTLLKPDPRRQNTKNTMYASIYGAGPAKIALTAHISEEEARATYNLINSTYPTQAKWRIDVPNQAYRNDSANPYVQCPLTGRRQVAEKGKAYALVNYLIQGFAASLFKMKIVELSNTPAGKYMIAPVHDEIILDVPGHAIEETIATLQSVMNDFTLLRVPVTAGVSTGKRWGEKREL
jgi:DNA polymerase I